MVSINPHSLSKKENYSMLTSAILPRPIAFVTSISTEGVVNAAPFSFFNVVSSEPPLISLSIGRKNGIMKDTSRNILDGKEFVVHVTDEENVEAANQAAANLPPDESEVKRGGLSLIDSIRVKTPGLKEAAVRMECMLEKHLVFQEDTTITDFIIGRVVQYHIADSVYKEGKIDVKKLKPVARLGGKDYTKLGDLFSLERP
ncbi:flavin reductase family protein [Evansella cellulosilytica]|uniref:Flavin reductase domain protein FMN-binding protein n=1 Tax=Evansella cellulosilytica (strain ATCC 21833 / DSM 2522 / FERM P-1141 / JCM 9156 / N-4) TaxID=649639 RepID=E6U023_EVAC2|nr:flavin reductase family protein [Evansella cellulosilytica]ADU29027.1 flavin reductase domain protein FMN-binding protein [Evansella cellulosilytica DSM 2522]